MIVGRFAPSPTGSLHLGSLVAAVGSWLFARAARGRWLVRMEDLDPPRVVAGCADDILRTLESLGMEWDGEVLYQSTRCELYREALGQLVLRGSAYPCGCSRAEIARVATAPHDGEGELVYPGTCRGGVSEGKEARAYRVRTDSRPVIFDDMVLGRQTYDLEAVCGDFVLRRGDGLFAYQLAVVVDDAEQGVNQVVRGSDLLSSTPRQIHLQRLLGLPTPTYAHLPLVVATDGTKLSKRDSAVSVALNTDPGRLLTGALSFLGQEMPDEAEKLPVREILNEALRRFDPSRVPHTAGPFPPS